MATLFTASIWKPNYKTNTVVPASCKKYFIYEFCIRHSKWIHQYKKFSCYHFSVKPRCMSNRVVAFIITMWAIFCMRTKLTIILDVRVFKGRGCWLSVGSFLVVMKFSMDLCWLMWSHFRVLWNKHIMAVRGSVKISRGN